MIVIYSLVLFIACGVSTAVAEELCIQVRTVVDGRTDHDGNPIVVKNTEILAVPGKSFHARLKEGDTTVTVDGTLHKPVDGKYLVEFREEQTNVQTPDLKQITSCQKEVGLDKPDLIVLSRNTARWTGPRGRVHNSWTYLARTRIELIVKKMEDETNH